MRLSGRTYTAVLIAASIAGFSSLAIAQDQPGAARPTAEQRQAWIQHRQAHQQEARAALTRRLHDVLNLRPDQDAALGALIEALTPPPRDDGAKAGDVHKEMVSLTTPERLDRLAAHMADHQAAFQRRAVAIKQFYAALSPEQQRAFDALPGLIRHDHHMGLGHGHDDGRGMGCHGMGPGPVAPGGA